MSKSSQESDRPSLKRATWDRRSRYRPVDSELARLPTGVEVFMWRPTGKGQSSFGHLSARVDDTMYSWGPSGMTIEPYDKYMTRNAFRPALGRKLDLSADEKQMFEEYLKVYGKAHKYNVLTANCADPVEEALELMGYPMGYRMFPRDVGEGIVASGLSKPNDYTIYPANPLLEDPNWFSRLRGPWSSVVE